MESLGVLMEKREEMDIDQIVTRLEAWAKRQAQFAGQLENFRALTGAMPDCALLLPMYDVWSAYTVAVSELVGDNNEWLSWFELECEMGRRPMTVKSLGGKEVKVRTLRQLARVIAY